MPPSFEEKVEALRRLKERRQAKQEEKDQKSGGYPQAESKDATTAAAAASLQEETKRADPAAPGGVGEADALFCAGHCLERGLQGCPINLQSAAEMYRLAAEQGHMVAQWRLGELLERGTGGVAADAKEAAYWYTQAAEAGNEQAQSALALLLEDGKDDVKQDLAAAKRWHTSAAEQGHALSQYCLACILADEDAPNAEEVELWLRQSAAQKFQPAVKALEDAAGMSTVKKPETAGSEDLLDLAQRIAGQRSQFGPGSEDLLDLAQRIAEQLGGLEDEEADCVLESMLADVPTFMGAGDLPSSDNDDQLPESDDELSDNSFEHVK